TCREVVRAGMNAAEDARLTCLISRIEVCSPLEPHLRARADLEGQSITRSRNRLTQPAREEWIAGKCGKHFRCRAAERAMAGVVTGKRRRHKGIELIRHPLLSSNPTHPAIRRVAVKRLSGPGEKRDLTDARHL